MGWPIRHLTTRRTQPARPPGCPTRRQRRRRRVSFRIKATDDDSAQWEDEPTTVPNREADEDPPSAAPAFLRNKATDDDRADCHGVPTAAGFLRNKATDDDRADCHGVPAAPQNKAKPEIAPTNPTDLRTRRRDKSHRTWAFRPISASIRHLTSRAQTVRPPGCPPRRQCPPPSHFYETKPPMPIEPIITATRATVLQTKPPRIPDHEQINPKR